MSAGRILGDINDPPIIVHIVPLGNVGQMTAGRQVEHLAFLISDKCIGTGA